MGTRGSVNVTQEVPPPSHHHQRMDTEAQRGAATGSGPTPLQCKRAFPLGLWTPSPLPMKTCHTPWPRNQTKPQPPQIHTPVCPCLQARWNSYLLLLLLRAKPTGSTRRYWGPSTFCPQSLCLLSCPTPPHSGQGLYNP